MNNPDRIHDIMDHIDPALLQQGDALAKRPISRIGKAAIIAACLCALLIGGTFAAEYLAGEPVVKLIGTNPVTGEEQQGFYTIIEPAENASDAVETPTPATMTPPDWSQASAYPGCPSPSCLNRCRLSPPATPTIICPTPLWMWIPGRMRRNFWG